MDWQVQTFASLSSTQDHLKSIASECDEGLVIQALTQEEGRGRHGRNWFSPMGGLYMSVLLRPNCESVYAGQLSFVVSLALSAAMHEYSEQEYEITLKWPNDVLINGFKSAGILLETDLDRHELSAVYVGIGVNILSAPENAIELSKVIGDKRIAVHPFRDRVLHHLSAYYEQWQTEGFPVIKAQWMEQAHGLDNNLTVTTPGHEKTGIFKGLDDEGALLLEIDGSIQKIYAGDVSL